ncbi:hypothetical protein C8J57DRAFT_1534144 [Mycena rebaudengoi]|nr:hypothetical protein C8J57DRAFT_1534144 [Mycena rebaudengoi]
MPPKIWSSCLDSFKDFFAYLQNARPVPFWNCLYQVDFHAPLVQRADESAFTNDNETVFLTTLFGKAMGPVKSVDSHRTFHIEWGPEGGDTLHQLYKAQFAPLASVLWEDDEDDAERSRPKHPGRGGGWHWSGRQHDGTPAPALDAPRLRPERYAPVSWGRPQLATGFHAQGNSHAVPSGHGGPLVAYPTFHLSSQLLAANSSRSQYSTDTDRSSAGPNAHITFRPSPLRNQPSDSLDLRALWENHCKEHTNSVAPAVDGAQETAASVAQRYDGLVSSATGTAPEGLEVHDLSAVQAQLLALNDADAAGNNHYNSTIDLGDVDAAIGDQDVHSEDRLPDFANTPSEVITDSAVQKKLGKRKAGAEDTAVKRARMVGPVGA